MIALEAFYPDLFFLKKKKLNKQMKSSFSSAIYVTLTANCVNDMLRCNDVCETSFSIVVNTSEQKTVTNAHTHTLLMFRSIILYAVKYFMFRILCNNNKNTKIAR